MLYEHVGEGVIARAQRQVACLGKHAEVIPMLIFIFWSNKERPSRKRAWRIQTATLDHNKADTHLLKNGHSSAAEPDKGKLAICLKV